MTGEENTARNEEDVEGDVEGHGRFNVAVPTEPPGEDVEGHSIRGAAHMPTEPTGEDVEGHRHV